ncbi:PdaC/SigV domain-containing protein [Paenibacillus campinasensis]|uniref:DUF4163 domain-containing protein n=1 Tax=Paenibacillus campinasensis TaxID=66347 RepID=A0A268EFT4_9BACL|nr:DUF4163 domain-containing protein [Paenibacillus campinasensis]PAD71992.1 hypothetical protein CHH67_23725 [Paenibacillus campinasensis]
MKRNLRICASFIAAGVLIGSLGWTGQVIEANGSAQAAAASQKKSSKEVVLKWNGKVLPQKGILSNGVTYVPATAVRDALGLPIKYDAKARAYTLGDGYNRLKAVVYASKDIGLSVNGLYIGEPGGQIIDGRLYIPYKVLSDYMGVQGQWNAAQKTLSMVPKKQNAITISAKTLKESTDKANIQVRYAQISGLGNDKAQSAINETLKQHAERFIEAAKEQVAEAPSPEPGMEYEFQGDFVVTYNAEGLLSILTSEYTYTGGAHGMTYRQGYTFSLEDGSLQSLGDVINLKGDGKKKLNDYVLKKFKANEGYLGGFEGVSDDADFYLKDGSAVLFFQLYEYTAYAYGFPEFELKLKEWK